MARQNGKRRWRRKLLGVGGVGVGLMLATWWSLPFWVPLPDGLANPLQPSLTVVDRDGQPLRRTPGEAGVSQPLTFDQLPVNFVHALLAAEDHRFYRHPGVDPLAVLRVVRDRVTGRRTGGGSGLTQQLIKLGAPDQPRTWGVKFWQTIQALALERRWDKPTIVAAYANRTSYGRLNRGVAAAATFYFDKPVADLSPAECALLAALPHAPGRLQPLQHYEAARERQRWILQRMGQLGMLEPDAVKRALQEPLVLANAGRDFQAPHFVEALIARTEAPKAGDWQTTLDLDLQQTIERQVTEWVAQHEQDGLEHAAVVVIDNRTGDLLAMIGSADYRAPDGMVNGALAVRSPGSALKPFLYLLAFEDGQSPASLLPDVPMRFESAEGVYEPVNFNLEFQGPIRSRLALANSLNVPAVYLLRELGGPVSLMNRLRDFGITTLTEEPDHYGLGLAIGGGGVTLLELTNAYATLARLGEYREVRWSLQESEGPTRQVADERASWLIADILADPRARVRAFGRRGPLRLAGRAAVKTGTSSDFRDNWALGYTPTHTVGVWTGNFAGTPMRGLAGITGAAPILAAVLEELKERDSGWFVQPDGLEQGRIDPVTGARLTHNDQTGGVREYYRVENPPALAIEMPRDEGGRLLLPPIYHDWLQEAGQHWQKRFSTSRASSLRIVFPTNGSRFILDPDLPGGGRWLAPEADRAVEWKSPTLEQRRRHGRIFFRLEPGAHDLLAVTPNGREEKVSIVVRERGGG